MRNLLIISNRYPPEERYPLSPFVKDQVDAIKNYLERVVVIAANPYVPKVLGKIVGHRRKYESLAKNYSYDNVDVFYTKDIVLPFNIFKNRWGDRAYKKSYEVINTIGFKPDIIHAHFTWPSGYAGVKIGKKYNVPVVVTAHGYDVYDLPFRNKKYYDIVKWTLDNSDYVITVSKKNFEIITQKLNIPEDRVKVIPNGYDEKIFHPMDKSYARKKLNLPQDKRILLTVGNLVKIKGHIYLIEAIKKIVEKRKDILMIIVGVGPEKNHLIRKINEYGISKYVHLVGGKSHDEIPLWMNAADLFVLPSLSEGNPTVMFEALGVGLPFIGTTVGGIPEVITSEDYGFLCPPKDPECLAEKILMALEKDWDREKIRKYAEQFKWENIAREILKIYKLSLNSKSN